MSKINAYEAAKLLNIKDPELERLPLNVLWVDPEVQRSLNGEKVRQIIERYTPAGVGVLSVSRRVGPNGQISYHVADGQHRAAALRQKFGQQHTVLCNVFTELDEEQEAALFLVLNASNKPSQLDAWNMRVRAGEPAAVGQSRILDDLELRVSPAKGNGSLAAVVALDRVWKRGPGILASTLSVLKAAFGMDSSSFNGHLISGVGDLIARYGEGSVHAPATPLDLARLTERLSVYQGRAAGLLSAGKALAGMRSAQVHWGVAAIAVDAYNHGRRPANRLPEWAHQPKGRYGAVEAKGAEGEDSNRE